VLPGHNRDALIKIAEVLALVGVAAVLAGVKRDYVWTRLQNQATASLRQSMFERLQQTSMGFHRRAPFNTVLEGFSSGLTVVEPQCPWRCRGGWRRWWKRLSRCY
jgi:ABC-type multidrug transport system fused ATPase/permease subunit